MSIDLFTPAAPLERQHLIFQRLMRPEFSAEREELRAWAKGFVDRDDKFVQEFQMTFESSFWELYLNATLRRLGCIPDMSFSAPDFVIQTPTQFSVEAAIAGPAQGGPQAFNYDAKTDLPEDFTEFNIQATIRICNSFAAKTKRHGESYGLMPHIEGKPYVIAIGAYDRPYAHFAASRPILAALYGLYYDEAATPKDASEVTKYDVSAAPKSSGAEVPVGLFLDDRHSEVSAVIYSSLATWGKLRALADNPAAQTIYQTYHPGGDGLMPRIFTRMKHEYTEDLLDGLYVLHNPFAKHPLPKGTLSHPRIAEVHVSPTGELIFDAPDDFLLIRILQSVISH